MHARIDWRGFRLRHAHCPEEAVLAAARSRIGAASIDVPSVLKGSRPGLDHRRGFADAVPPRVGSARSHSVRERSEAEKDFVVFVGGEPARKGGEVPCLRVRRV